MSQKSSDPQAISFVSQPLKRDSNAEIDFDTGVGLDFCLIFAPSGLR